MHLNSQLLFEKFATAHFADGQHVLEIGPDGNPSTYGRALAHLALQWETADLADSTMEELRPTGGTFSQAIHSQHVMPNEYEIPVGDNTFDVVVAGQVVEHVRRIWRWVPELARVTKPGGKIVIVSPISWSYHEAPVDCWRIYPEGMQALCTEAGLRIITCEADALEPRVSRRSFYGDSFYWTPAGPRQRGRRDVLRRIVGWPEPTALDLITVAEKA
jgi:SAM-dependent methyltransferase